MPSPRLSPKIAGFLGLQMRAVQLLLVLAWAFSLWQTRPNHVGTTGGIDPITTFVTWTAATVIFGALIAVHHIFAKQLGTEKKGVRRGVQSW
jgi:hypothetical protein